MPESIIFPPQDLFLDLSWIPMVQGGDTSTSLLWRWENWISSTSSAGSLFPDFSPHSSSAGLFFQTPFLFYILSSSRDTGFLAEGAILVTSFSELPTAERTKCSLAPDSPWMSIASLLTPHFSHPVTVPLTFTRISRHLSELLSNHPCSSDTCQEYTGLHCWVEQF